MKRFSKSSASKGKERVFAEIDLNIIERNYKVLKEKVGNKTEILSVVKADAYGHGMIEVSKKILAAGCNFFGVSSMTEGIQLRKAKIEGKILILGGILPQEDISYISRHNLTPVVHDIESLRKLISFAKKSKRRLALHLKFDTGMGRLGLMPKDAGSVVEILKKEHDVYVEGLMSHFSESEKRNAYGLQQVNTFKEIIGFFSSYKIRPTYVHMSNTGGLINYPEAYFDIVRVGIGLYGSYPSRELEGSLPIREGMSLKSRIAFVKEFPEGASLSYGRTYVTGRTTKVGFVPCGYSDGYKRGLSNSASVIIRGRRCPIVGRICMDWTLVDITDTEAGKGDEVILLGGTEKERITAWELAEKVHTIPYEIFCGISKSVRRYYL